MTDDQEKTFRYERKFVLDASRLAEFRLQVKLHPAMFREAYPPRYVNNLYLDTLDRSSYFDNVEGMPERTKMRVRWYGELLGVVDRPFLEYKLKRGVVGTKRRYDLPTISLSTNGVGRSIVAAMRTAELPASVRIQLPYIEPTLLNRYRREYFESARGFRVTLDTELRSINPNGRVRASDPQPEMIVELKYDRELELEARTLLSHFGLRVMKNSKYVVGLEYLAES